MLVTKAFRLFQTCLTNLRSTLVKLISIYLINMNSGVKCFKYSIIRTILIRDKSNAKSRFVTQMIEKIINESKVFCKLCKDSYDCRLWTIKVNNRGTI